MKFILGAFLFVSVIAISCNNDKKTEATEPAKTEDSAAAKPGAPGNLTEDSAAGKPGAPGNLTEDSASAKPGAPGN